MKLCFPLRNNDGLESRLFNHFGLAPLLLIVDSETGEVEDVDNRKFRDLPGPERFRVLTETHRIDALVALEIGIGAFRNLQALGIRVLQGFEGTVAENLSRLADNNYLEIETENIDMIGRGQQKGYGRGMGRGLNCRATAAGRGLGRRQGAGYAVETEFALEERQGLGLGRGLGRGQGQGLGMGQGRGMGRGRGMGFRG